jgi:hypothetical protein
MLHPAVRAMSSVVMSVSRPYTSFISSASAFLRETSPMTGQYPHVEGSADAFEAASRRICGGAIPGTPCDRSRRGRDGDGTNDWAHSYARGMLCE